MKGFAAAITVAIAVAATAAVAETRVPTTEERIAIDGALQSLGFKTWGKVALDGGKWQIAEAVHDDGNVYDVDLKTGDLTLIDKKREK